MNLYSVPYVYALEFSPYSVLLCICSRSKTRLNSSDIRSPHRSSTTVDFLARTHRCVLGSALLAVPRCVLPKLPSARLRLSPRSLSIRVEAGTPRTRSVCTESRGQVAWPSSWTQMPRMRLKVTAGGSSRLVWLIEAHAMLSSTRGAPRAGHAMT